MAPVVSFALLAAVALVAPVAAYYCNGDIYKEIDEDVYVNNGHTCYLKDGAVISGSVHLGKGANLKSRGNVIIKGISGIRGRKNGWLDIGGHLTVRQVDIFQGKWNTFYGAKITSGELKIEASDGDLIVCGTEVADVLEYKENTGNFYAVSNWWAYKDWWGCQENKFLRDVKIEFVQGNVKIIDQEIEPGELYIKGVSGKVDLRDVEASKMKLEKNRGEVFLYDVEAYEAEIKENSGGVKMWDTEFDKAKCFGNSEVDGYDNEFEYGEGQCKPGKLTQG